MFFIFVVLVFFVFLCLFIFFIFFFKQKTAYEMRISDWSSDVCSSDLEAAVDLQIVDRQPREQRQARIAGAEIVDRDRAAERADLRELQIGRASCRERVCQYV